MLQVFVRLCVKPWPVLHGWAEVGIPNVPQLFPNLDVPPILMTVAEIGVWEKAGKVWNPNLFPTVQSSEDHWGARLKRVHKLSISLQRLIGVLLVQEFSGVRKSMSSPT